MTERREPFRTLGYIGPVDKVSTVTLTFRQYQTVLDDLHIAQQVIIALLEKEGRERCPNCGWSLKGDGDGS